LNKYKLINWLILILICIGLILVALGIFIIPELANEAASQNPEYAYLKIPTMIFIYITTLPFFAGLYEALKICRKVLEDNSFSDQNGTSLIWISRYAVTESILYTLGSIILFSLNALHPGILILVLIIIFAAATIAIFSTLLAQFVNKAVEVKKENELTI
jgi:uncharacterized membrane protein (DUF106 family)